MFTRSALFVESLSGQYHLRYYSPPPLTAQARRQAYGQCCCSRHQHSLPHSAFVLTGLQTAALTWPALPLLIVSQPGRGEVT